MFAVRRDFEPYSDRIRKSGAFFIVLREKIAVLVLDCPDYRPTLRDTPTHGLKTHAT
jgi:hypothetical protein